MKPAPTLRPEPVIQLMDAYKADSYPSKVNLGIGAYRNANNQPVILDAVKKAKQHVISMDHEYVGVTGNEAFTNAAIKLLYGNNNDDNLSSICATQAISGTGACRLGAEFLARNIEQARLNCYIPVPTWSNHWNIMKESGFQTYSYQYYNEDSHEIDMSNILHAIHTSIPGSVFLLHACGHNPSGADPSIEQWIQISDAMLSKKLIPFFDCAYLGYVSGSIDTDAFAVRYFAKRHETMVTAQSFSKNLGLYGERVGVLSVLCPYDRTTTITLLQQIIRPMYSMPPSFGARIAHVVMTNESYRSEWFAQIKKHVERLDTMRTALVLKLGSFHFLLKQKGMFAYTGLTQEQMGILQTKYHIYGMPNGRLSIAGLNESNIDYVANAILSVTNTS